MMPLKENEESTNKVEKVSGAFKHGRNSKFIKQKQ